MLAAAAFSEAVLDVSSLPGEAARYGRECCVTGVVTMASVWRDHALTIADPNDPNGPALYVRRKTPADVRVGDVCEVRGVLFHAFRGCGLRAASFTRLGSVQFPPAPLMSLSDIVYGGRNLRRVRLRGVLRRADGSSFEVGAPEGVFAARVDGASGEWSSRVNSTIELEGVVLASYTQHGKFVGVLLDVCDEGAVSVLEQPPEELIPFREQMENPHARAISGTVTYTVPGKYFVLQNSEDTAFVVVRKDEETPLVGSEVDVCGFATPDDDIGEIRAWKTSVVRRGVPLPLPIVLKGLGLFKTAEGPEQGFNGLTGCRVTISGTLIDVQAADGGGYELGVTVPDGIVRVSAPPGVSGKILDAAPFRPELEVTGVALISIERSLASPPIPDIASFRLLVADPNEVRLEPDGEWLAKRRARNVVRLLFAAGTALILLLAAKLYVDRRRRLKLDAIIAERKRMSADLHDTLEQNLAVANMFMNSSLMGDESVPREVAGAIASVSEILAQTKRDIREVVWNLRNDELFEKSPEAVIREQADKIAKAGVRVRTRFRGLPAQMQVRALADLVNIVREKTANAIKHGKAKSLLFVSDPVPGGFALTIADDGAPFDPASAPGPELGHFGMSGMRERARKSGFALSFGSDGKLNTLRIEVKA